MNITILKFLWIVGCFMVLGTGYAQSLNADLSAVEEQRFKAMMGKDTAALGKLLSSALLYVHSNGIKESKSEFIHSVGTGKMVYGEITHDEPSVISKWDKKTVTINGMIHVKGVVNSNQFDIHLRYLSVYVKRKGTWELARWQSAKM